LIGLLASWFHLWTEGYPIQNTPLVNLMNGFAIMFAVLQASSGLTMMQQCAPAAPGQMGEVVPALLKVVNAFGVIAFGFACRSIYVTSSASPPPPAHLVAIESFIIINFLYSLLCSYSCTHGVLVWESENTVSGKQMSGAIFGGLQTVFAIVLMGLLAGLIQKLTSADGDAAKVNLNAAGNWMVMFGLLFSVFELFAGFTMLEHGSKKLAGLGPSDVSVSNKVACAIGALAMGFACRHINLFDRKESAGGENTPLVHAIESFIIINFFLTWAIDWLTAKGKIKW
jgi:hypothetical protein